SAADHPEPFVETYRVDHERFAFPMADGIAEITRNQYVFGRMLAAGLHRNPAPIAVLTGDQENAIHFRLVDNIEAIWHREKPHAAGGIAAGMGIIESVAGLAEIVESTR